ncbi:MAG: hypothetical protein EZS28_016363 [Streblomastix strix]|uniref:Uncharacterized protein n=1 Tax=Streblomastix strix TaxID=222440 RepID=A0A5J4VZU8_9EUKA|nr:MAG: hypothetical protein EZS28_016363 [Streblomastix strix]
MNVFDPFAITVERENHYLDQHAGQPLSVPENQPAMINAVLQFMKNLLNQTAHIPKEQLHQQQISSAQLLFKQYYDEKVADYDPTGKHPIKYELEAMEDRIQASLGLEINKREASAAAIASLTTNDAESAAEWILSLHHLARIIAVKAQQRREQAMALLMFRGLLSPDVSASDVFGKKSKEKLKEQIKPAKLIEHPKVFSATNPKPVVKLDEVSQTTPTTSSSYKAVLTIYVVGAEAEEDHINVTVLGTYTHIIIPTNQASSKIIRTNFCHNSLRLCRARRHYRTNSPHNNRNRNESRLIKTLRSNKKQIKPKNLRARVRRPNDQHIINQKEVQKEGTVPHYQMDLEKTLIPDR